MVEEAENLLSPGNAGRGIFFIRRIIWRSSSAIMLLMSLYSALIILFAVGFPLLLIFFQGRLIRRRLPWLGMLVGLIPPILFWLLYFFVLHPTPEDCNPQTSCQWVEWGLFLVTIYAIILAVLFTLSGFLIHMDYQRRIWTSGEIVKQTGKIPAIVSIVALLLVMVALDWFTSGGRAIVVIVALGVVFATLYWWVHDGGRGAS